MSAGLTHLGLLYESPEDFAATVCPHVRGALDDGRPVRAMVGDEAAAALVGALGGAGGRIRFDPPLGPSGQGAQELLERLRAWGVTAGPALVVGQYAAGDDECAAMEDGINLLLADLPLTVLCACARSDGPARAATARRSHPGWATGGVPRPNPDFRVPPDRCRVRPEVWGRPVLRASFRGLADLARVRREVIEVVCEMGLCGPDADAAVLAVHEAAVLGCRAGNETGVPVEPDAVPRTVEVRATATSLFAEVRAPSPPVAARPADAHTVLGAPVADGDLLRHLIWFCHRAAVEDGGGTRTIRIAVDRRRPAPHRRSAPELKS